MKTVFIYALKDPTTGSIRYVGKSDDPCWRYKRHLALRFCENTHKSKWIRWLAASEQVPILEILDEVPESEWEFWEREWIRLCRALGFDLVNGTDGGDGVRPTPEIRKKISDSQKGEKSFWFGKIRSLEERKKMSASQRKRPPESYLAQSCGAFGRKHCQNTSGFVGVSWDKRRNKWMSEFQWRGRKFKIGRFFKREDAVFARALAIANRDLTPAGL